MSLLHSRPELLDDLWKGVKPLLQTRAATVALTLVRRNPKTAIALAVATGLGALVAAIAKKRASSTKQPMKLLPMKRDDPTPGYVANPSATNGSPAITQ